MIGSRTVYCLHNVTYEEANDVPEFFVCDWVPQFLREHAAVPATVLRGLPELVAAVSGW